MFDLTAFVPFVIGFFALAAVAAAVSVATLVTLAQERRSAVGRVVPIPAAHPAVAATTRRAA
jgi:hypothetical protein